MAENKSFYKYLKKSIKPRKNQSTFTPRNSRPSPSFSEIPHEVTMSVNTPVQQDLSGSFEQRDDSGFVSRSAPKVNCHDRAFSNQRIPDVEQSVNIELITNQIDKMRNRLEDSTKTLRLNKNNHITNLDPRLNGFSSCNDAVPSETLTNNNYLGCSDSDDGNYRCRVNRSSSRLLRNPNVDPVAYVVGSLEQVLRSLNSNLMSNKREDGDMKKIILKSQKSILPKFDKSNSATWLRMIKKRLEDYNIVDEYQKYQLIISLFDTDDLSKLEPYLSLGDRDDYYRNLLRGINKVFLPTQIENEIYCQKIKFEGNELPSIFAAKLRGLLGSQQVTDEDLKIKIHCKLPKKLLVQMTHHVKKPLNEYLEIADDLFSCSHVIENEPSSSGDSAQNSAIPKSELIMMTMLSNIRDNMHAQNENIQENRNQLNKLVYTPQNFY